MGGEVDGIGASRSEDQLGWVRDPEVAGDFLSGQLIGFGGGPGEVMCAAVDVRIDGFIKSPRGIEHCQRLLCGGGVVEIHQL